MSQDPSFHRIAISGIRPLGSAFALAWKRDFDFSPGQLVSLALREGGESRLYSLASGPREDEARVLFNVAEGGALTPSLAGLGPGDELWLSGPSGSFPAPMGPGVWIANGTGVAPFVSMARAGLAPEKRLLHGARALEDFYFQDELAAALGERYTRCLSGPGREALGTAGIFCGRLTAFIESRSWDPGLSYELCGSALMVVEVRDLLIDRGVPHSRIISEVYF